MQGWSDSFVCVPGENWASWLDQQDATTQSWAASMRFSGRAGDHGRHLIIPDESGKVKKVVLLVGDVDGYGEFLSFSALPTSLPRGVGPYKFISFGSLPPASSKPAPKYHSQSEACACMLRACMHAMSNRKKGC